MALGEGFKDFVLESMAQWNIPGIGLAVVENGELVFCEGFGLRNVKENLPATAQTMFAIGSSTKAFTTTSMAMLVDEGKLDWDKPVREYLPWFRMHDQFATERITPRDLVTHRSGLPRHDLLWYNSSLGREDLIRRLRYLEPSKDFRTAWQYQNLMFLTAGYLAGQVAGSSWEELVQRRIFAPLGMTSSNLSVDESRKTANYSLPYKFNYLKESDELREIDFRNIDIIGPAGSINSNVEDMAKWLLLQVHGGKVGDQQLVAEANLKQLHSPQMVIGGSSLFAEMPFSFYGMGWFVGPYRGINMVQHGGNIDGFSALVSFLPEQKHGVVILTNMNGAPLPSILAFSIYDRLLGLESIDWNARVQGEMEKGRKANTEKTAQTNTDRKPDTSPSHDLAAYAGQFEHPGYGVIAVSVEGEQLQLSYNQLPMQLRHYHYDVFVGKSELLDMDMLVTFFTDPKGNIDSLSIPLEPTLPAARFTRRADESMQQRAFLEQFVGAYQMEQGPLVTVALKGESTLTVTLPGQPSYELEPYQGTNFTLKGLPSGFSAEFVQEAGLVTAMKFHQPNGVFAAARV